MLKAPLQDGQLVGCSIAQAVLPVQLDGWVGQEDSGTAKPVFQGKLVEPR